MSKIIAIDPGPEESAAVEFDIVTRMPCEIQFADNYTIRQWLASTDARTHSILVVEYTPPYTLTTGSGRAFTPAEVVKTAIEVGRFVQAFENFDDRHELVSRLDVKKHLLGRTNGNDAMVNAVLYERYGGSRTAAKGTKKSPGPLHGFSGHLYAALAVAVTWAEKRELARAM